MTTTRQQILDAIRNMADEQVIIKLLILYRAEAYEAGQRDMRSRYANRDHEMGQ